MGVRVFQLSEIDAVGTTIGSGGAVIATPTRSEKSYSFAAVVEAFPVKQSAFLLCIAGAHNL